MFIFTLLFALTAWSQTFTAQWNCPQDGRNSGLNVPDSLAVNINVNPYFRMENFNFFDNDQQLRDTSVNYGECVSRFLRNANAAYATWAATCPAPGTTSRPAGCALGTSGFEAAVYGSFNNSWLTSRNRNDIKFLPPSLEPAAAILQQEITANPAIDLMDLAATRDVGGVQRPLADFGHVVRDALLRQLDGQSSNDEKRAFIDSFAYKNANSLRSVDQIRATCTSPADCATQLRIREEVLFTARQMLARVYRESEIEGRLNALCPVSGAPDEGVEGLLDSLRNSSCSRDQSGNYPLREGEFRMVEKRNSGADYLLRRTAEGLEGTLNINFDYQDGAITPTEMNQRVQNCVALANQHMRGPDQTPFRIRVINPAQAEDLPRSQRPDPVNIDIQRMGWRSHAATYSSRVDCDTITHELLHLFRLCDEYKEGNLDYGGCRIVVRTPSIMSQSQDTYAQTVPQAIDCTCNAGCTLVMNGTDEDAKRIYTQENFYEAANYDFARNCIGANPTLITSLTDRRRVTAAAQPDGTITVTEVEFYSDGRPFEKVSQCPAACPAGTDRESCEEGRRRLLNAASTPPVSTRTCPWYAGTPVRNRYVGTAPQTGIVDGNLRIGTQPRFTNLLHPNHFNKILAGNCSDNLRGDERSIYDQCASFSTLRLSDEACTSEENQPIRNNCSQPGVFTGAVQPQ